MIITLFTNYLNHYQIDLAKEFNKIPDVVYKIVLTEPLPDERKDLGWVELYYENQVKAYENATSEAKAAALCVESDVVLFGSCPEKYVQLRMAANKLSFRFSERIFKNLKNRIDPRVYYHLYKSNTVYKDKKFYLLSTGAYAAPDFNLVGAFKQKSFRWGYFPRVPQYDIDACLAQKQDKTVRFLWVGRLIDWKHPEQAIQLISDLVKKGFDCQLKIVGTGHLDNQLKAKVTELNLDNHIEFIGGLLPDKVHQLMMASNVFLFTSDRGEGWGVVLNEAMSAGCTVIAYDKIGAVPYMINDGVNGIIYHNYSEFLNKTTYLLQNPAQINAFARKAYATMLSTWNPQIAVERLVHVSKNILNGDTIDLYKDGLLSLT